MSHVVQHQWSSASVIANWTVRYSQHHRHPTAMIEGHDHGDMITSYYTDIDDILIDMINVMMLIIYDVKLAS